MNIVCVWRYRATTSTISSVSPETWGRWKVLGNHPLPQSANLPTINLPVPYEWGFVTLGGPGILVLNRVNPLSTGQ